MSDEQAVETATDRSENERLGVLREDHVYPDRIRIHGIDTRRDDRVGSTFPHGIDSAGTPARLRTLVRMKRVSRVSRDLTLTVNSCTGLAKASFELHDDIVEVTNA